MESVDWCPICREEQREFEHHHVIWRCDKGSDHYLNLLKICKSCHALLTKGNMEDRTPRDMVAVMYQLSRYGCRFLTNAAIGSNPLIDRILAQVKDSTLKPKKIHESLKNLGQQEYEYQCLLIDDKERARENMKTLQTMKGIN